MTAGELPVNPAWLSPDEWTMPFWEAAQEHRLVCAQCTNCGRHRMPPSPFCPRCRSQNIEWHELPGTGTIYTFTIVRHAVVPELKEFVPYVIAVADLDEAPHARLVADVVECTPEDVTVGARVRVKWHDSPDGITVPRVMLSDQPA